MKKIIFLVVLSVTLFSCKKEIEHTKPILSDITESIYASGKVKALDQYNVFSTVNGILKDIYVKPGDSVMKGAVMFLLDNVTSELNAENARLVLELSQENNRSGSDKLQELELNKNLAFQKYILDSSLFIRQKKLWDQQVGSQLDFEQRKLNFESSKNNYQTANSRFNQIKTQLINELKRASVNYNLSQKQQSDYQIKSDLTGSVYDVLKEKGELVTPQTPLAVVGQKNQFYLELEVDENDIASVKLNQQVEVTMDSYKGQVFEALVTEIYPIMNERTRTFLVKAKFKKSPEVLYPNLSVEANIILQTKKNALIIPRSYLVDGQYVWVSKDEKKEVKTGLRDYQKVEILSGLDSNQVIYKPQ